MRKSDCGAIAKIAREKNNGSAAGGGAALTLRAERSEAS